MSPFRLPPVLGQKLESFRATNFSGGLDVQTSPTVLANLKENRWLTKATNVVYGTDGSVGKRWGMVAEGGSNVLSSLISGGIEWTPSVPTGTRTDVVATTAGIVYTVNTGGFTSIKSGLTSIRPYSFAIYNDLLHVANGTDAPQKWDGTTWAALGGSSPATSSLFVAHGNRLFALATAAPSRAYWCKLNNTTDWSGTTDAGFLDVNPNDGGVLTTLVPSNQELILGKMQRPYRLQGIGPTTGYTVVDNMTPAAGSIGPTAMQSAVFAGNDVWYGSQAGIHRLSSTQQFGDLRNTFVSRRIEPYFRPSTSYSPYSDIAYQGYSGTLSAPTLAYDSQNELLIYAYRTSSGTGACDSLLVYNIALDAWATWGYPGAFGALRGEFSAFWPSHNANFLAEMRFGMLDTSLTKTAVVAFRRDQTSDVTLNGGAGALVAAGIAAQVRHVSNLGAPGVEKAPRYLYLYFAKESATTTMTLNLYADFKTTAAFTTTFDITSSTAETLVVKRIDLGGFTCEFLEVDLQQATAGKGFTLYGYQCDFRTRRTTRRAE